MLQAVFVLLVQYGINALQINISTVYTSSSEEVLTTCRNSSMSSLLFTFNRRIFVQTALHLIIIIINDNVYGAVLVTMVTARVHLVHLMNAD